MLSERSQAEKEHIVWCYLYEVLKESTEIRAAVAWGQLNWKRAGGNLLGRAVLYLDCGVGSYLSNLSNCILKIGSFHCV